MREAIYSVRHCPSLKSKIKTLFMQITQLEHGLTWTTLFSGCFRKNKVNGVRFSYIIEILQEEWTGRQEILVIREAKWD